MSRKNPRRGRSLVEVLIVSAILIIAIGLVMVVIAQRTDTSRRTACENRMSHLAAGLIEFDQVERRLPGWAERLDDDRIIGWPIRLAPFLPEEATRGLDPLALKPDAALPETVLPGYVCPADPKAGHGPALTYVLNAGLRDAKPENASPGGDAEASSEVVESPTTGMVFNLVGPPEAVRTVGRLQTAADGDGLDFTLLASENLDATTWHATGEGQNAFCWVNLPPASADGMRINHRDDQTQGTRPRPSSLHGGGVVVVMASGEVSFVSEEIDWAIWAGQFTPDGSQAVLPNGEPVLTIYRTARPKDASAEPR
jgi:Tfp pilus assembly protein PilV